MTITKPFHRNFRPVKPSPQSGYSVWAYIEDRGYAKSAEHYIRAFTLIQNDLQSIFEYVEPSNECLTSYSYRIHALLMRTCIEVEANFKAILEENKFTRPKRPLNMTDYRKVDVTHHLSSYEVMLPIWNGSPQRLKPFAEWKAYRGLGSPSGVTLPWYRAYNASKHDRQEAFRQANMEALILAVSGLLVLISSQFRDRDFSATPSGISFASMDFHPLEHATGSLFRIKYPDDWSEAELYEFDWTILREKPHRFDKIDYNIIPS